MGLLLQAIPLLFVLLLAVMRVSWTRTSSETWLPKWARGLVPSPADQKRNRLIRAVAGLSSYEQICKATIDRKRSLFFRLNKRQQLEAAKTYDRYRRVRSSIAQNARIFEDLVEAACTEYKISKLELLRANPVSNYEVLDTFNHFVRDWSGSTATSRCELFTPILDRIKQVPLGSAVLVPGSGVGGLAHELAHSGYKVDALEYSPTMHLGAQFATAATQKYSVYPYLLDFSHLRHAADQFETTELAFEKSEANFHFEDFLTFDAQRRYDAIVTLFFIDTAENPIDYLDRIASLVAPGGIWINYGPLKWGTAPKVEFAMDELMELVRAKGWEILETFEGSNRYSGSAQSLWEARYRVTGWVAKRVQGAESTV